MCGTKCLFPELLHYSLAPPFPPDAMLNDSSASLSLRTTLHGGRGGGGGGSRIWPKERWLPCEKLIDVRGSAFCKLVPHNFGQDCSFEHFVTSFQPLSMRIKRTENRRRFVEPPTVIELEDVPDLSVGERILQEYNFVVGRDGVSGQLVANPHCTGTVLEAPVNTRGTVSRLLLGIQVHLEVNSTGVEPHSEMGPDPLRGAEYPGTIPCVRNHLKRHVISGDALELKHTESCFAFVWGAGSEKCLSFVAFELVLEPVDQGEAL